MIRFLRNPEVMKTFLVGIGISLLALLGAWLLRISLPFTFVLCLAFLLLLFGSTLQRYKKIASFAAEIDLLLHSEDMELQLGRYREGELGILESEIHKMTVRLKEQRRKLLEDKVFLADSLADISHQLRTPLTSVHLLLELLSDPTLTEEERTRHLHEILSLLSRIDWLIETLLKLSRLDAGTVRFTRETISLLELLRQAAAPLLVPIELREQTLSLNASGDFTGDVAWTLEAIGNIVKNCMEHTPDGGCLALDAEETALYTEIRIQDNGGGILAEDLPHIFERFYKGKNATSNSFGIGLALARTIIKAQNGSIKAENRAEGGALFTVRFYKSVL